MIKDKNILLALGMLSLSLAIILGRYLDPSPTVDALEGLLFGISFALNIFFLLKIKKQNNSKNSKA